MLWVIVGLQRYTMLSMQVLFETSEFWIRMAGAETKPDAFSMAAERWTNRFLLALRLFGHSESFCRIWLFVFLQTCEHVPRVSYLDIFTQTILIGYRWPQMATDGHTVDGHRCSLMATGFRKQRWSRYQVLYCQLRGRDVFNHMMPAIRDKPDVGHPKSMAFL